VLTVPLLAACGGSGTPGSHPSSTILATEAAGTTPSQAPTGSPSATLSGVQTWTGHGHLSYTVPLQDPCKGTADFDLQVVVAANGAISGGGTGGYSPYTCHTRAGDATAPGASASYKLAGEVQDGHLVFVMAPDPPGPGLPPAWPTERAGSFDIPISGKEANVEVTSSQSLGAIPGRLKLTVLLTCVSC